MVETEFLFGFQPKDRRYDVVSKILKAYAAANDKAYDEAEVKRIPLKEFLNLIAKQ